MQTTTVVAKTMDFDYERVEKLLQEFVGKKGVVVCFAKDPA